MLSILNCLEDHPVKISTLHFTQTGKCSVLFLNQSVLFKEGRKERKKEFPVLNLPLLKNFSCNRMFSGCWCIYSYMLTYIRLYMHADMYIHT